MNNFFILINTHMQKLLRNKLKMGEIEQPKKSTKTWQFFFLIDYIFDYTKSFHSIPFVLVM